MLISGSVRNSVKLAAMDTKWQQKKNNINSGKQVKLTQEEQQINMYQQQLDDIRESQKPAGIDAKLESGRKLTPEEIEYLRKNNPQALRDYENTMRERKAYERQLKNCKSKEDVEKLKLTKMGEYAAAAKNITNNPHIPKDKKLELVKKLLKQVSGITAEHLEFVESLQYQSLPEDVKDAGEKKGENKIMEKAEDNTKVEGSISDAENDIEELRKMVANVENISSIDISIEEVISAGDTSDLTGMGAQVNIYI